MCRFGAVQVPFSSAIGEAIQASVQATFRRCHRRNPTWHSAPFSSAIWGAVDVHSGAVSISGSAAVLALLFWSCCSGAVVMALLFWHYRSGAFSSRMVAFSLRQTPLFGVKLLWVCIVVQYSLMQSILFYFKLPIILLVCFTACHFIGMFHSMSLYWYVSYKIGANRALGYG